MRNPSFDVTPAELITGIATDEGLIRAPYEEGLAEAVARSGAATVGDAAVRRLGAGGRGHGTRGGRGHGTRGARGHGTRAARHRHETPAVGGFLMATIALGRRTATIARQTTDRAILHGFLAQDRLYAAYAICDLEEREFGRTRWGAAYDGDTLVAVGLEYTGPTPQPLFVMGRTDGIEAVLRDVIKPRAAYIAARPAMIPAVEAHYRVDPGPQMVRMWVDRPRFRPYPATVQRLLPVEIGELNKLYQLGFASWLPSSAIADGVYYGMRINGQLVAAAGTHVVSASARLAVVGNVLTHVDFRGRGFATAVTGAVTVRAAANLRPGRPERPGG